MVAQVMKQVFKIGFYLASIWSLFIVSLVVIGNEWALPRAAGGQFESFPIWLRFLYLINVALISFQVYVFARSKLKFLSFFLYLNLASAIVNLLSRSTLERWNALAAAAMALAIWVLRKDLMEASKKS